MFRTLLALVFIASSATLANAQSFTESFDGGSNDGGWTWNSPCDLIPSSGGNPGAYLGQSCLDTYACQPHTTDPGSAFCGDWQARSVSGFGVDLITHSTQFIFQRELHLILFNGSTSVYVGHGEADGVPQVTDGWKSLDFVIDSQSSILPPGWSVFAGSGNDDADWLAVISNVTEVRFFYGDPTYFFIFDQWFTGMDNPRITTKLGTNYCQSGPNGAVMSASGSASVSDDDLTLHCDPIPNNTFGLFYFGNGTANAPLGNGFRCVSVNSATTRLGPPQNSGSSGAFIRVVDLPAPTPSGSVINPGSTWYFQAWFRDGSSSDLSDGLQIDFTP
jgi:hypothetical protein